MDVSLALSITHNRQQCIAHLMEDRGLHPCIEWSETSHSCTLLAHHLSGLRGEDLRVEIDSRRTLVIRGKRCFEEMGMVEWRWHLMEPSAGRSFRRPLRIPHNVNFGAVTASFQDGVLQVIMPKFRRSRVTFDIGSSSDQHTQEGDIHTMESLPERSESTPEETIGAHENRLNAIEGHDDRDIPTSMDVPPEEIASMDAIPTGTQSLLENPEEEYLDESVNDHGRDQTLSTENIVDDGITLPASNCNSETPAEDKTAEECPSTIAQMPEKTHCLVEQCSEPTPSHREPPEESRLPSIINAEDDEAFQRPEDSDKRVSHSEEAPNEVQEAERYNVQGFGSQTTEEKGEDDIPASACNTGSHAEPIQQNAMQPPPTPEEEEECCKVHDEGESEEEEIIHPNTKDVNDEKYEEERFRCFSFFSKPKIMFSILFSSIAMFVAHKLISH